MVTPLLHSLNSCSVQREALARYEAINIIIHSQVSKTACPSRLYWGQPSEDIQRAVPSKCIPKLYFFLFIKQALRKEQMAELTSTWALYIQMLQKHSPLSEAL